MHQVPARVWNAIAATGELRNPSFQTLMAMPQDKMLEALEEQSKVLTRRGVPDAVISAYQELAPLLAEHEAISQYINQTGNSDLRAALPEILSPQEAVAIAAKDRPLSASDKTQLKQMLTRLAPTTSLNA